MDNENSLRQELYSQGITVSESDIGYIQNVHSTIQEAQVSLKAFSNKDIPIIVIDKGLML